jgi:DNA-directed RNA polymerase subunit M/transcription elongation factor TFIIS
MLPSGEYSSRIAPADAMVINFWRKKSSCGVVKSLFEASIQKARNRPSTQLIEATSCAERWNATIKAKDLT